MGACTYELVILVMGIIMLVMPHQVAAVAPELLFTESEYILRMNMDGSVISSTPNDERITRFAIDIVDNMIYYSKYGYIKRRSLDNNTTENIHKHDKFVMDIAVDWIGRKLYWVISHTSDNKPIYASNLDGTHAVLITHGHQPSSIALHPQRRLLFWVGYNGDITRMGMDGSNITGIVTTYILNTGDITVDLLSDRIWWSDPGTLYIESVDLDGGNRQVMVTGAGEPGSIAIYGEYVYWVSDGWVERADRFTDLNHEVIYSTDGYTYNIRVNHPSKQPTGYNPCGINNAGCSHLCLLSPEEPFYSCLCPESAEDCSEQPVTYPASTTVSRK